MNISHINLTLAKEQQLQATDYKSLLAQTIHLRLLGETGSSRSAQYKLLFVQTI